MGKHFNISNIIFNKIICKVYKIVNLVSFIIVISNVILKVHSERNIFKQCIIRKYNYAQRNKLR